MEKKDSHTTPILHTERRAECLLEITSFYDPVVLRAQTPKIQSSSRVNVGRSKKHKETQQNNNNIFTIVCIITVPFIDCTLGSNKLVFA